MAENEALARDKVWAMIRDVRVAMLTSEDGGSLHSRPMVAAQAGFDGHLWFFTRAGSRKVAEVARQEQVCVSYADPGQENYVSLSGSAHLVRDPAEIGRHWSESARVWFPKGKDDPDIALLRVDVDHGEYWDAPSSAMLHLYGYAKARMTGEPPHPGGHGQVKLG